MESEWFVLVQVQMKWVGASWKDYGLFVFFFGGFLHLSIRALPEFLKKTKGERMS